MAIIVSQVVKTMHKFMQGRQGQSLSFEGGIKRQKTRSDNQLASPLLASAGGGAAQRYISVDYWGLLCLTSTLGALPQILCRLFSLVSGWVMYWKRRSASSRGGGSVGGRWLPPLLPGAWEAGRVPVVVMGVVLCIGMPVLAVAVVLVMVAELLPRVGQKLVRKLR